MSTAGRILLLAAFLLPSWSRLEAADGENGLVERVARTLRPAVRRADARLAEIERDLGALPRLEERPIASRYGFRSRTMTTEDEPQWVQLDLGRSLLISRVVAVPTYIPPLGERGAGFGFPRRFKVQAADNPDMENAVTLIDRTAEDVPNPGRAPLVFRTGAVRARHLRFTSTRHFAVEEGYIWALEELLVLSGNLAASVGVPTKASSNLEVFPNWSQYRINDGFSALGMPVTTEASPSFGYRSSSTAQLNPVRWLSVDLGREFPIEEVRLLPVQPDSFETLGPHSLPRAWKVELATDPEFTQVTWSQGMASIEFVQIPGGSAVVLQAERRRGRYIRLVAQQLWRPWDEWGFGLAEFQAYSGGENVAMGKEVMANSSTGPEVSDGWASAFVVDGFSSRYRLTEWPHYLDLIERRMLLEAQREDLARTRERLVGQTGVFLACGGGALGVGLVLSAGWLALRQRQLRRRAVIELREQIARDLHDEIGSTLGGIILLSEMGTRRRRDIQASEDFATIGEAAERASQALQDIIWMIHRGNPGLRELLARMKDSTGLILGEDVATLRVDPADYADRSLSPLFRRNVLLAFKEVLNNARRHAQASAVDIRIHIGRTRFAFEVRDDGTGFDPPAAVGRGHGLDNLQRRAEKLHGSCRIQSGSGTGTTVFFSAPWKL